MRGVIVGVLFLGLAALASAQNNVFVGQPASKVSTGAEDSVREVLASDEASKYLLVIEKRGDRYFWKSRGGRELVRVKAGLFDVLLELQGAGYIKILDPGKLGEVPEGVDPKAVGEFLETNVRYVEFMTQMLDTVTYFGTAEMGLP